MTTQLTPIERLTFESNTVRLMMKGLMVHINDLTEGIPNNHPLSDQIEMIRTFFEITQEKMIELDKTCEEVEST